MWKYKVQNLPCDILMPGMELSWNMETGEETIRRDYMPTYGSPIFIRWIDSPCQNSCELYGGNKEFLILTAIGERMFHPLWFIRCKQCRYYR